MRNSSAYVPIFLNSEICCILSKFKTLFLPKFLISNFHTGVRARGAAAWQILPARRRSAAACIPGGPKLPAAAFGGVGPFRVAIKTENFSNSY